MDRFLKEHARRMLPADMVPLLADRFGTLRTPRAIITRMVRLGLSTTPLELTALQVARIFHVRTDCVTNWLRAGLLSGTKVGTSLRSQWKIKQRDIERFIDEHTERYDWHKMPSSRYRALAEVAWRTDPVYPLQDAARIYGIGMDVLYGALMHGHLRGVATNRARGVMRRWVVRRSTLLAWRDQTHAIGASTSAHDVAV